MPLPGGNDHDIPTAEQLRRSIDSGETGDKVDFRDPAAVPLGADAEAAGAPPQVVERRMAMSRNAAGMSSPSARRDTASWPYWMAAGTIALVLVLGIGWFAV